MSQPEGRLSGRSYRQYCAVARGLDVVGERWTLLIVRDLLTGPKRYKDLLAGLPGIGTNLLAARLREMEEQGIVTRRVLPPPAGSTVYELTDIGQALEPAITALGRWGFRFLGRPGAGQFLSANAYLLAMRASFHPEAAVGLRVSYELRIGKQVFEAQVADGRCTTREGRPRDPEVVLTLDVTTLGALLRGDVSPHAALACGDVVVEGNPEALEQFVRMFALRAPGVAAKG